MDTKRIGNIGEAMAIAEFTKRHIPVLIPFGDNELYDLVIEYQGFKKIQVKTSEHLDDKGSILFYTKREGYNSEAKYSASEIDFFFLYSVPLNRSFLIPVVNEMPSSITIRTQLPKNHQVKGIRLADDYTIDNILFIGN